MQPRFVPTAARCAASRQLASACPIPASAGIGLRFPHHRKVIADEPDIAWYEIHPENYMDGGAPLRALEAIRRDRPIAFHATGMSLGSVDPVDRDHLRRLKALAERIEPGLVSDHLSWSIVDGAYLADLLPLPYTQEALEVVARNVDAAQDALGRAILVENPSTYLAFRHSTLSEAEFLTELVARTGCGILCDVNNAYVSARNLGHDPLAFLGALPAASIGEIHLAGHAVRHIGGADIRIDDHGSPVISEVWALYEHALDLFGPVPTLIEWDTNIPAFEILQDEALRAQRRIDRRNLTEARHARSA